VGRSILNWKVRWEDGDLPYVGINELEFRTAYNLRDKGRSNEARREVLRVLTDHLGENLRSTETSLPS
jgi:hypothetical protein